MNFLLLSIRNQSNNPEDIPLEIVALKLALLKSLFHPFLHSYTTTKVCKLLVRLY